MRKTLITVQKKLQKAVAPDRMPTMLKDSIDISEKIASVLFKRVTKQQEVFRILYIIIDWTHWIYCVSKIASKFVEIEFAQSDLRIKTG